MYNDREIHHSSSGVISGVPDDWKNDRTHMAAPGGRVIASFEPELFSPRNATADVWRQANGTIRIKVVILKYSDDSKSINMQLVDEQIAVLIETLAPLGLSVEEQKVTVESPIGKDEEVVVINDLSGPSGVMDTLSPQVKSLIEAYGTTGTTSDITIFYIGALYANQLDYNDNVQSYGYAITEIDDPACGAYINNIILNGRLQSEPGGFRPLSMAHEMAHVLTGDRNNDTDHPWRILYSPTPGVRDIGNPLRYTSSMAAAVDERRIGRTEQ